MTLSEATATVTSKSLRNMTVSSVGPLWLCATEQRRTFAPHNHIRVGHPLHWTEVQYLTVKGRFYDAYRGEKSVRRFA